MHCRYMKTKYMYVSKLKHSVARHFMFHIFVLYFLIISLAILFIPTCLINKHVWSILTFVLLDVFTFWLLVTQYKTPWFSCVLIIMLFHKNGLVFSDVHYALRIYHFNSYILFVVNISSKYVHKLHYTW